MPKKIGLILGPILFILFLWVISFEGLSPEAHAALGVTLWISVWWLTEVIALAATSLLPILLFPLSGALDISETTTAYGHPFIFLFLGGFILAIAIEKWNLHKRIALSVILRTGTSTKRVLLGFMAATAILSMWISNTAATVMLLPICMAVINLQARNASPSFARALLLGVAYAASIGGMATLIGTPPNLILAGIIKSSYHIDLSFVKWMAIALPLCILLFLVTWLYLQRTMTNTSSEVDVDANEQKATIQRELNALGPLSVQERKVGIIFLAMVFLWISRGALLSQFIPELTDTAIALLGAMALFLTPAGSSGKLMEWDDTKHLPWGILILFGAGMAIAKAFELTELAKWIGMHLINLENLPFWLLLLVLVAAVNFLTEFTSNMATTAILLPILISLTSLIGVHEFALIIPATFAASCAFMLPVATAPNALIFASGKIKIQEMVRYGFVLNILAILLVTFYAFVFVPVFFGG